MRRYDHLVVCGAFPILFQSLSDRVPQMNIFVLEGLGFRGKALMWATCTCYNVWFVFRPLMKNEFR